MGCPHRVAEGVGVRGVEVSRQARATLVPAEVSHRREPHVRSRNRRAAADDDAAAPRDRDGRRLQLLEFLSHELGEQSFRVYGAQIDVAVRVASKE